MELLYIFGLGLKCEVKITVEWPSAWEVGSFGRIVAGEAGLAAERIGVGAGKGYGLVVAGSKAVAGEEAFVAFRNEQGGRWGWVGLGSTLVRPGNSDTCFDFYFT